MNNEEFKEPVVGFAKFLEPGDELVGTYVGKQELPAKGIYKPQIGYNILVDGLEQVAAFGEDKSYVHKCMRGAKIGQRVKFLFEGWFEQDSYKKELKRVGGKVEDCKISRAKTIKVFLGNMDKDFEASEFKEANGEELSIEDIKFD